MAWDKFPKKKFTEHKPAISSMRRNLQTEHLEKLFDLANEDRFRCVRVEGAAEIIDL